jgi:hypothetical protein
LFGFHGNHKQDAAKRMGSTDIIVNAGYDGKDRDNCLASEYIRRG